MKHGFYWKLAVQNLKNHRRIYFPYILSATGITMMFYMLFALAEGISTDDMYGGATVATIMYLGVIVIGLFAVLFLFYTNSFIMKRRKKELGLYNILGMEKFHIGKVIFCETFLTALITVVFGLGFGIFFSKVIFLILGKILAVEIPIAFLIPPVAVICTALLFLAIFFLTMLYNILQVRLSNPIELLHGSNAGEKEPRAHWLLAILGAAFLGAGYYIAVTIQDPVSATTFFFLAVLAVIAGTYLLFTTGITALLKLLKKNDRFYYKANHFTAVSGMLYRMKQNAAGLASICILFTCLLVTVSTTFSLYTGLESIVRERYPRNIMISGWGLSDATKAHIKELSAQECEKAGFEPLNVLERESLGSYPAARNGAAFSTGDESYSATYAILQFFDLESYNRTFGLQETLAEDEILLQDPRGTFPKSDTLTINDSTFKLRRTEEQLSGGETMAMIYESYYLVVKDWKVLTQNIIHEAPDEFASHYCYYFDIDGSKEDIIALHESLADSLSGTDSGMVYESLEIENVASNYQSFFSLYGGLFFLGIFLGFLFLMGTALIIYYKQVSEGYEDARRFTIMQQVGMSRREVKKSIHSQILLVFFLPLLTAVLHLSFAFPMLQKILMLLNMTDFWLLLCSTLGCAVVFGIIYAGIYMITAKVYAKIVDTAAEGQ